MYELKRAEKISECVQIGGEILEINIDPSEIAMEYNRRKNEVIRVQQMLSAGTDNNHDTTSLESYGNAIISIFSIIFGDQNTKSILSFYDENYVEMLEEVMPFFYDVVEPKLKAALENLRKKSARNYKGKQRGLFGLAK